MGAVEACALVITLSHMLSESTSWRPFATEALALYLYFLHTVPTALILVLAPSARRAFRRRRDFGVAPAPTL